MISVSSLKIVTEGFHREKLSVAVEQLLLDIKKKIS